MKVVFTDLFDGECQRLNLSRDSVLEFLNNANKTQDCVFEGLTIRMIFGMEDGTDSRLLVISCVQDDQTLRLDLIFRILSDLFNNINILNPLLVVQLLAQRYGLVLRIGQRLARLFYQAEIALSKEEAHAPPVIVSNPSNHDFILSSYVKTVSHDSSAEAKCALIFCIDRLQYDAWLSRGSQVIVGIPSTRDRQVTRIIPIDVAKAALAGRMQEPDSPERFYRIELDLALRVVVQVMGQDWYESAYSKLPKVSKEENPILLRHYARVIGLAHFLNQLWREDNSNNLSDKIAELRSETFEHAYYELKIAAHFDRRGLAVTFLKREKGLKTPDFSVTSTDGFAMVECKRKTVSGIKIDNDLEDAVAQIEEYSLGPGIVFIEVIGNLDNKAIQQVRNRAFTLLQGVRMVKLCVITNEVWTDEIDTIAVGGSVWPIDIAAGLPTSIYSVATAQSPVDWPHLSAGLP